MLDLRLQIASVVSSKPFSEQCAGHASGSTGQRCGDKGCDYCSTGNRDSACRHGCSGIRKASDYATLGISNRFRGDICRARSCRIIFESARVGKAATQHALTSE
jgi:hypothetical protein